MGKGIGIGKGLFKNSREKTIVAVMPNQINSAYYFLLQIKPAINYALKDLETKEPKHALIEAGLMTYLMGLGFDFRTARAAVEAWQEDENIWDEGIITET